MGLSACSGGEPEGIGEDQTSSGGQVAADAPALEDEGISVLQGERTFGFGDELTEKLALVDPTRDEWQSEVFESELKLWLSAIGDFIAHGADHGEGEQQRFTTDDYLGPDLRPALVSVADGHAARVRRRAPEVTEERGHRGEAGFRASLQALAEPLHADGKEAEPHVKLKVVHVDPPDEAAEGGQATTATIFYQTYGPGSVHQSSTWTGRFVRIGEELRLVALEVSDFEEVERKGSEPFFADCTEAVLGNERAFREEFEPPLNKWRKSLDRQLGVTLFGHQGIAVGDVNGDGLDDLFAAQVGGLPCRLFVQQPDGSARDTSAEAGVDFLNNAHSALFADFDGDGDQDLAVTMDGLVFLENDGTGKFEITAIVNERGGLTSMAAADYDLDGDLDLYVCTYDVPDKSAPIPYHDANNGPPNALLRNDGDWQFSDVTRKADLTRKNRRYSFACSWEDYDNDGDPDLYVANDFGRNNLYRNDGGRFTDVAAQAGVEDISAGMAVTWNDYDGDGLMDIYVSNMWSSAGNRVTYQRNFRPGEDETTRSEFQRHARGNSLFRNRGDGTFEDVSLEAGVEMGRWSWSSSFIDLDNDTNDDLLVTNGFLTNEVADDL